MPVPAPPGPVPLTSEDLATLATVQRWADLVASAQPDGSDPALFAEVKTVFPAWEVDSAERLSTEFGNIEAAHLVWVRTDDDGTSVVGGLIYDNASTNPCRTGFLCWRADVESGVINSLTQVNVDGTLDDSTPVTSDYPYVDGRWIGADDELSSGVTVQARLIELCDAAIPTAGAAPPASGFIEGTAVATSSGGGEACKAQPNGPLPAGLVEGAPVTIRDALSGEVIGTGTVSSTTFLPLTEETTSLGIPPWTCTFNISATLSAASDSITVQVGELRPWGPVSPDDSGGFRVQVPTGTDSTGTVSPPGPDTTLPSNESTVVPDDSTPSDETSPPA